MPTTTKWGIYYPDGSTLWNPALIFSTAATSVDEALSDAAKVYGQPYYASAAARDAAYAPAAGMPALVIGMSCSVAGVPQVYLGPPRGWNTQTDVLPMLAVRRQNPVPIPTSTWTVLAMDGSLGVVRTNSGTSGQSPVGLTPSGSGITVANTGAFRVDAAVRWATSTPGVRFMSIGTGAADTRVNEIRTKGDDTMMSVEIDANAGQTISIICYQTSGASASVARANLQVRQVA